MSGSRESVVSSVSEQEFGSMFPALEFFPVSLRENDDRKLFITGPVSVTDLGVRLGKPRPNCITSNLSQIQIAQ